MEEPKEEGLTFPKVTIVIINSRGGELFRMALKTAEMQIYGGESEILVIENLDRSKTIGACWNEAVRRASGEYCLFLGDDDQIPEEYLSVLMIRMIMDRIFRNENIVACTSYYTGFDPTRNAYYKEDKFVTGLISRDFILEHPFDEDLKSQVDSTYYDKEIMDNYTVVDYYHGYFYRQHNSQTSGRNISENKFDELIHFSNNPFDVYVVDEIGSFTKDIVDHLTQKGYSVLLHRKFNPLVASNCKVLWCEWAGDNALQIDRSLDGLVCKKILRIHSYEVYSQEVEKISFDKWDKVIFVSEKKKEYLEKKIGREIANSLISTIGTHVGKFNISKDKQPNNKIAYVGYLCRKKGLGELMLIARELKDHEFHLVGTYQEEDMQEFLEKENLPNVFVYPWTDDLNSFYADKSYVISPAIREGIHLSVMEGMSCGCMPLVRGWIGSDEVYDGYIWDSIEDLKNLLKIKLDPEKYRGIIMKCFQKKEYLRKTEQLIKECINGKI